MAKDLFRSAARKKRTLFNAWIMTGNSLAVELVGAAGWDCVTIDQQHGAGGNETLLSCLTAAKAAGLPAIVRAANNDPGLAGQALDAGAQGVMCPLINNVDEAERFVQSVKYPPRGFRSWGPYRAKIGTTGDFFKTANRFTIACPQIETKGALDQLDEILGLKGVDMVCVGPNDLSVALTGKLDIWAKEVQEAMVEVRRKAVEHGVMTLIFCNDVAFAKPRIKEGWDVVTIGTDMGWITAGAADTLAAVESSS